MSQFFGQQLLAAQYFRPQYLHGTSAVTPSGHSGYWKLFYYQLQEAELEKEKLKQEQEQGKGEAEVEVTPVVSKPKLVAKHQLPVVEELTVHPRPIYQRHPEPPNIEPWLNTLSREFRSWNDSMLGLTKVLQKQKVANDEAEEDEVIIMLLLAA